MDSEKQKMIKRIIIWGILIALGVPGVAFSQIIEDTPIHYNGYPGEPKLQPLTRQLAYTVRSDSRRESKIITLYELQKLSEKFPDLRKYDIIVEVQWKEIARLWWRQI